MTSEARHQAPAAMGPLHGRKARFFSWRLLGLYLAPTPLIFAGLGALVTLDPGAMLWSFGAWGAVIYAAGLTRDGMRAEAEYAERAVARPPAIPRKIMGAGLIGAAMAAAAFFGWDKGAAEALFVAILAGGAHLAAFGLDPMRSKGIEGVAGAEAERMAEQIARAERQVDETVAAAARFRDRKLEARVDGLARAARAILREIEGDPRDLRRARRFLSVYLTGLRDATVKFAEARMKGAAGEARAGYEQLLSDLEGGFAKQRESLLVEDKQDLEVEIDVLRDRLRREGALREEGRE